MTNKFRCSYPIPPGELVEDSFEEGIISRAELQQELGLDDAAFDTFLKGHTRVTQAMADQLAATLGGSSRFWIAFDQQYLKNLTLQQQRETILEPS